MAPRVLVCLEDTGVSLVVAARLMREGAEGVVVGKASKLADEARKGAVALVVHDRFGSGEVASSLLRQVRVARGEVVPAVVIVTGDLAAPDRHVLEKQYKVQKFLGKGASASEIAEALQAVGGFAPASPAAADAPMTTEGPPAQGSDELELHDDEKRNEFDISIESQAALVDAAFDGAFDGDEDASARTVQISQADLQKLKAGLEAGLPTRRVHEEVTAGSAPLVLDDIVDTGSDLSQLPAPGGDDDFNLLDPDALPSPTEAMPAPSLATSTSTPPRAAQNSFQTPSDVSMGTAPADSAEGDPMQIQELQRTQAELKKVLLAERKAREVAQKRVEELEAKLAKMGEAPTTAGQGVPTEGVFEDLRYPALLARCRAEAFTGSVSMQSGGTTRSVYMKDGLPVAFSSSEPGQRIGQVLVSQGRITDVQYMKAATRMVEKSIKLTDALVELGLIDGESLAIEQRNLTRDQIIQGFEIVQGRFTTTANAAPDANTATFDFGPGEIYVQGYRRYAPTTEMLAAYETLRDKYLIANARLAGYRPKLGLIGEDERMLRLLGEALTVEEAAERAQLSPEHVARLLSALLALDLVEEWSPGVEQFRSRIRAERQRTVEDMLAFQQEYKRREERLLEAFEKALAGRGGAGLSAALEGPTVQTPTAASLEASPTMAPPTAKATTSSSSTSSLSSSKPASTPPSTSASSSPRSSFNLEPDVKAQPPKPEPKEEVKFTSQRAETKAPTSSSTASSLSSSSSSSMSSLSSGGGSGLGSTLGSTLKEAKDGLASATITPPPPQELPLTAILNESALSPADKKYREGVEQAAQSRLDEAELTLREAVRLDATKPEYLTSLARVLLANPRYERSGTLPVVRSLLDRAVQIAPDHPEANELHKQVIAEMGG
jgi:hypothetical protein